MSSATTAPAGFSNEEIVRLLELLKGADSVELKLTVPEPHQRSTVTALELDPLEAQIRQVFFFDTPELALDAHGVVVRARRIQGKGGDSIVKLRPVVPSELPEELRRSGAFRVEVDALPGGFVCSGTLKGSPDSDDVLRAASGKLPLRKLFSKEQRQLYAAHAPEGSGSTTSRSSGRSSSSSCACSRRASDASSWRRCGSTRTAPASSSCRRAAGRTRPSRSPPRLRAFLVQHGVDLSGEQETKTRKALEYFARGLRGEVRERRRRRDRPALGVAHLRRELRRLPRSSSPQGEPARVQESDEVYLLSEESDASVKIRDGLMDVKRLEAVDGNGLEQWRPVLKSSFPLAAADVAAVLDALGVSGPELARDDVHARAAGRRARPAAAGPRGRRRAQAARPLRARRLHGRAVGGHGRPPDDAHDRRRGGGSRARARDRRRAAARRPAERVPGARAQDPARARSGALRGDRRRHELRQAPPGRATHRGQAGARSSTAPR